MLSSIYNLQVPNSAFTKLKQISKKILNSFEVIIKEELFDNYSVLYNIDQELNEEGK